MFGLTPYEQRKNLAIARKPRDVFEYFFGDSFPAVVSCGFPGILGTSGVSNYGSAFCADIRELDDSYVIEADLPGFEKDEVKVDMNGDVLTLSVEKNEEKEDEKGNYLRRERRFGSFTRSFRLEDVNRDGISAKFENGVLSVVLPKQDEKIAKKRQINIL